jgi:hypothetical protein
MHEVLISQKQCSSASQTAETRSQKSSAAHVYIQENELLIIRDHSIQQHDQQNCPQVGGGIYEHEPVRR